MSYIRHHLHPILGLFLLFFGMSHAFVGMAQTGPYPNRPIKFIIPFPPGNTTDIMTRLIAPKLQERLGQSIVVENKAGASGIIGMDFVAKSKPDGYTIVASQGGTMVVLPHTNKATTYDPIKDFAPIALSTANYLVVVSSNNVPFKTFPEMLAWAKANPGKLTVATNGEGGFPHLTFEHLAKAGGISFTHIPYKGSAAIVTDLGGGQVMVGIDGISGPAPHIRSGLIKLLAVTNKTKISTWPNTPTVAESIPNWDSNGWFSYSAPAGTPKEIINKLNAEINRAIDSKSVKDKLTGLGLDTKLLSANEFRQYVKAEVPKWARIVKESGATAD